jgi:methionyl-tRNA formyltransferase
VKLIFLGTPVFAAPTLRAIAGTAHSIAAVITQPDRPSGRGMKPAAPPVKAAARELGLSVLQPETVSSPPILDEIRALEPQAAVVVAYGRILNRDFLDLPPLGCVNLHPSLLPRHRGPTPIQSAILSGDRRSGVTTMLLDEGVDTGDLLLQKAVDIPRDATAGDLHDELAEIGARLMIETLDALDRGEVEPSPQDESMATLTRKLTKEDSTIDWSRTHEEILNLARAMHPAPGCRTKLEGKDLKIWKVQPLKEHAEKAKPGAVLEACDERLIVQSGGRPIRILELQPPGGKRMSGTTLGI